MDDNPHNIRGLCNHIEPTQKLILYQMKNFQARAPRSTINSNWTLIHRTDKKHRRSGMNAQSFCRVPKIQVILPMFYLMTHSSIGHSHIRARATFNQLFAGPAVSCLFPRSHFLWWFIFGTRSKNKWYRMKAKKKKSSTKKQQRFQLSFLSHR